MGVAAERLVQQGIAAALTDSARSYPNVRFLAKTRPSGPAHDGEADVVIVHPEHGLLVVEVKSGEPSRDAGGRWFIGGRPLDRSPYKQAEDAKHDLRRAIVALPDGPRDDDLRAGHAVAFPDVDLATLPRGHVLLGPDATSVITLDAEAFADVAKTRAALERAWSFWVGDGTRGRALHASELAAIDDFLAPTVELHRLLRRDVDEGRDRLIRASNAQLQVLNWARSQRRVEVIGPAGSGKSLVAVEKACRLAREGWRTLFVCFNQALSTSVLREIELAEPIPDRRPRVATFHRLAEMLGREAQLLGPKPEQPGQAWFDELAKVLAPAIEALPDTRFDAIVIDEGQDFREDWLIDLQLLLEHPDDGVLWVFHDPGQALFVDDVVDRLGLEPFELFENFRSPGPVAELANRFYRGPGVPLATGQGGTPPRIIDAEPGAPTDEAVRRELHRILVDEGVRAWDVVVLSGASAGESAVWKARRFGNVTLWNGVLDDAGHHLGLPGDEVPDEPADDGVVLFDTVRRFKGLERPVVILCELPSEGDRLDQLLYTALTRATTQLIAIAPPDLATRLRGRESR